MINSSLLSLSSYYLLIYPIPDSALDKISQSARNLLWANSSNRSGMPMVGWSNTTLDKPNGGLGLWNLRLAKHSLMAKNVFNLLNKDDYIWVDIVH